MHGQADRRARLPRARHPRLKQTDNAARPPGVVVTLLAPATTCNQRCPRCILDLTGEPVRDFSLSPQDYARFVGRFVELGVPVRAVTFQGYEVTLPRSWPYVEEVFRLCQRHGIPRSFITNGMLLDRRADSLRELGPRRITVSLDGSSPGVHDPIRGLAGAFKATTEGIRRFSARAPGLRERLAVASTLFGEENLESLLSLPRVLRGLAIDRWMVSIETRVVEGQQRPAYALDEADHWFRALAEAASVHEIQLQINDELGHFRTPSESDPNYRLERVIEPEFLYRLYPDGSVRVGEEILEEWNSASSRRWDPATDDPLEVVDYWQSRRQRLSID